MDSADAIDIQTTVRLVLSAKDGDRAAVEQLFERYAPRALRMAALRFGWTTREFEDYEDIAQDALLKAFKGLGGFDPGTNGSSVSAFRRWLATCVHSAILDCVRRMDAKKRPPAIRAADLHGRGDGEAGLSTSCFLPAGSDPTPSELASAHELESKLEQEIAAMKQSYQDVIVLDGRGLSDREIAKTLNITSEDQVRLVRHRARKKLKQALAEWQG